MVRRHEEELDLKDDAADDAEVESRPRKRRPTTRLIHEDLGEEAGAAVGLKEMDADEESASAMGQWLQLYEDSLKDLEEGEIVRGRVLKIDDKEVTVDVGFKSEGVIPVEEFPDLEGVKVGDEIEVFLEKTENQDGLVVLSKQRADAVVAYLAQAGIPRKIMSGVGKSYLQPAGFDDEQSMTVIKKANSDEKEMAENRRVQMLIRRKASGATQTAEKR